MAMQTQNTSQNIPQVDGKGHATLSSYIGLAIIGAIMMIMVVLQSAGAQDLIQ
ncbi:MAG: hypothetical protein QM773_20005 [Hyphomonadaceae bacterium]